MQHRLHSLHHMMLSGDSSGQSMTLTRRSRTQSITYSLQYSFQPPRYTPKDVPNWATKMDKWGNMMIDGCLTVAAMAAIGMDIPEDSLTSKLNGGPHLLAPTGSDLTRYPLDTVFAGFHYDLNFLTIHGKSRYPGLFVWLRNGEKIPVAVPEGHLLLQAGSQFDLLTGGYVTCGFHEVQLVCYVGHLH